MTMTKQEVARLFHLGSRQIYKKTGTFLYRYAREGETILTIVGGRLETINTCPLDKRKVILKNIVLGSSCEEYMIEEEKFNNRYEIIDEASIWMPLYTWNKAVAKGEIAAIVNTGPPFQFQAPWGEMMECLTDDIIASPWVDGSYSPLDIYRIDKETFGKTYILKEA